MVCSFSFRLRSEVAKPAASSMQISVSAFVGVFFIFIHFLKVFFVFIVCFSGLNFHLRCFCGFFVEHYIFLWVF